VSGVTAVAAAVSIFGVAAEAAVRKCAGTRRALQDAVGSDASTLSAWPFIGPGSLRAGIVDGLFHLTADAAAYEGGMKTEEALGALLHGWMRVEGDVQ
jgi:hypothetical protein